MKKNRILSLLLSCLMVFSFGACSEEEVEVQRDLTESEIVALGDKVPNYSNSGKKFEFVGYGMSNGYWEENGVEMYAGRDMYTVEDFTIYKEAGFTYMHPQGAAGIQSGGTFVFEASPLKRVMDTAVEAGIGRVIVPDYRIYSLISYVSKGCAAAETPETFAQFDDKHNIFTDDGQLDQTALENLLKEYMGEYSKHPAFYGVVLEDEPPASHFVGYGEVYRAIKRVYPDAFMLCNIHPAAGLDSNNLDPYTVTQEEIDEFAGLGSAKRLAIWKKYISKYLELTQCNYLMYDQYPIGEDQIHELYLRCLQIAAEVCKEKGVQLYFVAQTTAINTTRVVNAEDAAWLNNMLLGMGVKSLAYWTYCATSPKADKVFYEWGSFVTNFGEKTPLYSIMQNIMAQNQKMAPTVLCFDYQTSAVHTSEILQYGAGYLNNSIKSAQYAKVSAVNVDKESVLVSELYDKANGRYMYMIQNVVNPDFTGSGSWQTTTLTFSEAYEYALVLCDGEQKVVKLVNNQYSITQHPGKAVFVIPFNA